VDLHAIEARAQARKSMTSWRGNTCGCCGKPWPCEVREGALDELTGGVR
jgi:hypothetical protein